MVRLILKGRTCDNDIPRLLDLMDDVGYDFDEAVMQFLFFYHKVFFEGFEDFAIFNEINDKQRRLLCEKTNEHFLVDFKHFTCCDSAKEDIQWGFQRVYCFHLTVGIRKGTWSVSVE